MTVYFKTAQCHKIIDVLINSAVIVYAVVGRIPTEGGQSWALYIYIKYAEFIGHMHPLAPPSRYLPTLLP